MENKLSQEFKEYFDSYEWKEYLWKLSQTTGENKNGI